MTRTNKKIMDVQLTMQALEYFHKVHQSHLVEHISHFGTEHYNAVEERFYALIKKYNRKYERMRKRVK